MPVSGWELGKEKFLCSAFFCSFVVSHPAAIFGEQDIPGVRLLLICEREGKKEGEICISASFASSESKKRSPSCVGARVASFGGPITPI